MGVKKSFQKSISPIIGNVYVDLAEHALVVGRTSIVLNSDLVQMVNVMLHESLFGERSSPNRLMALCDIPSLSIFEQLYNDLIIELDKHPIANHGGNGSFYEDTVFASDLFRRDKYGIYFYRSLACIIAENDHPSDKAFESIKYFPRKYTVPACLRKSLPR